MIHAPGPGGGILFSFRPAASSATGKKEGWEKVCRQVGLDCQWLEALAHWRFAPSASAGKGGGALGFEADWALGPGGDRREGNGPRAAQLR